MDEKKKKTLFSKKSFNSINPVKMSNTSQGSMFKRRGKKLQKKKQKQE